MKNITYLNRWFTDFLSYNLVFFFLQTLYIISSEASFIHAISYPIAVYWQVTIAILIQIVLYSLLSGLQAVLLWGMIHSVCKHRFAEKKYIHRWQMLIYFVTVLALVSSNCYFFPLSRFSRIFLPAVPAILFISAMIMSLICLTGFMLIAVWPLIRRYSLMLIIISCLIITLATFFTLPVPPQLFTHHSKPNLFIIGIDSLSPEQINPREAPNLAYFLKTSTHFTETISPLARTYPAWVSILTGLYPLHHHARENLYPAWQVEHTTSFAWNLQRMGYRTIFASDERRFNNMGEEFGFQDIIGPRIGITDILLGSFYDFPLSNLLINSRISHWLFPWNYTNRAGFFSYYPTTFDQSLYRGLATGDRTKPLFLSVHFSLAHWPYTWAASSPTKTSDEYHWHNRDKLYHEAIRRVDQQVGDLLHYLKHKGALTNSVIIILSDHGEALYKTGSRQTLAKHYQGQLSDSLFVDYLKRKTATPLEISVGHGSDLLSPIQYHCLFGIKINQQGKKITPSQIIHTRVALIDIAPTIADLFHFNLTIKPDGISLKKAIFKQIEPKDRFIMLESGMLANQSLSRETLITYAQTLFEVNPNNNLLEIRHNQFAKLNAQKLYGIIYKNWLLALYPDDKNYIAVSLNLTTGAWADNREISFTQKNPLTLMLTKLRQFYHHDLSNYPKVKRTE